MRAFDRVKVWSERRGQEYSTRSGHFVPPASSGLGSCDPVTFIARRETMMIMHLKVDKEVVGMPRFRISAFSKRHSWRLMEKLSCTVQTDASQ